MKSESTIVRRSAELDDAVQTGYLSPKIVYAEVYTPGCPSGIVWSLFYT
jgi:hypothetical protein